MENIENIENIEKQKFCENCKHYSNKKNMPLSLDGICSEFNMMRAKNSIACVEYTKK